MGSCGLSACAKSSICALNTPSPTTLPAHLTHLLRHTHTQTHSTYTHTDTQMHLQRCTHRTDADAHTSGHTHTHAVGSFPLRRPAVNAPPARLASCSRFHSVLPLWDPQPPELCSLAWPGTEAEPRFPSPAAKWNKQRGRTAGFERKTSWASEKLICWIICLQTANCLCDSLWPSAPPSQGPRRREAGPSSRSPVSCCLSWHLHTPCPAHSRRFRKTTWLLHTHFLLTHFPKDIGLSKGSQVQMDFISKPEKSWHYWK